jgi:hypothetical protein
MSCDNEDAAMDTDPEKSSLVANCVVTAMLTMPSAPAIELLLLFLNPHLHTTELPTEPATSQKSLLVTCWDAMFSTLHICCGTGQ